MIAQPQEMEPMPDCNEASGIASVSAPLMQNNAIAVGAAAVALSPDKNMPQTQLEVSEYIKTLCMELSCMARGAKLHSLAYFIDMACIEATHQIEDIRAAKQVGQSARPPKQR